MQEVERLEKIARFGAAEPLAGDALDLAASIEAGDGPDRDQPQVVVAAPDHERIGLDGV